MKYEKGFTIIEVMLVLAILGIFAFAATQLLGPGLTFFNRSQRRQQANVEARKCTDTIKRLLGNAKATSMTISTPGASSPPNSRIRFDMVDGSSYTITWSNSPQNSMHIWSQNPPTSPIVNDSIVATNVTGLMFTGDSRDPAVINVTLQIDSPLDNAGSNYTVFLPNQVIRLANTQ